MAEATATEQQEWVDRYYSQEQLKDKRRNFLRSCNYAMFRGLVRSGEIDQHPETNANECRRWRGTRRARSQTMRRRTPDRPPGTHRGAPALCSAGIRTSIIVTLQRLNTGSALPRPVGVEPAYRNPQADTSNNKGCPLVRGEGDKIRCNS